MPAARAFLRAFPFAWNGLAEAVATQRNMRVHVVAGTLACAFAAAAPLEPAERALLLALAGLVLALEAVNTGVEALVDLLSPTFHERARVAKDAAAGAVLAGAGASVAVLAAVVAARWPAIVAARAELLLPAAGAAVVAAAEAWALARPSSRWIALCAGLAGLAGVTRGAAGVSGAAAVVAAGLLHLLAVAGAGRLATRRRQGSSSAGGRVRSGGAGGT
jgi:diacylglycerol kinase (ATP)